MVDIITLGEAIIDFVSAQSGVDLIHAPAFERAFGGAPANVAVDLARLGVTTGFIGKVGDDAFGLFFAHILEENGVSRENLLFDSERRTTLAFVSLTESGERDFMFYRHPGADAYLREEEIKEDFLRQAKIFHFGSLSLTQEPARSASRRAIQIAQKNRQIISFDPNLRLSLWDSPNREELQFLTGSSHIPSAQELLSDSLQLIFVSLGRDGCYYTNGAYSGFVNGYPLTPIDTTGAGDGFVAGILAELLPQIQKGIALRDLISLELEEMARFANAVAAIITLERGAVTSAPSREEVKEFMRKYHFAS